MGSDLCHKFDFPIRCRKAWRSDGMSNLSERKRIGKGVLVCIAVMLALPSILITLYSYPCQDDFHYAVEAKKLLDQEYNIFTMSIVRMVEYYLGFTGCYTSSFLGHFFSGMINCNIWGIRIFEFISAIVFYAALYVCLYSFAHKIMQFDKDRVLPLYCLMLAFFNCLIYYSDHDDFYWFITSVQYLLISSFILYGVSCFILCMYEDDVRRQRIFLVLACILGFLGSGGTLSIAAFCCAMFLIVFLWGFFVREKCRIRACVGMGVTLLGAVVNGIAPGNYKRYGEPVTLGGLYYAVKQSLRYTLERWETFIKNPIFWIIILLLLVILENCRTGEKRYKYKFPIFFVLFLFGLVAGIIFPTILGYGYECYVILNRGNFISDMAFYLFIFWALFYIKGWRDAKYPGFHIRFNKDAKIALSIIILSFIVFDRKYLMQIPVVKEYYDLAAGKNREYADYCIGIYDEVAASEDRVVEVYRKEVRDTTCMMNPQFYIGYYDYEEEYANTTIARFWDKDAIYLYLEDEE